MGLELETVKAAFTTRPPINVTKHFPASIKTTFIGMIHAKATIAIQTHDYGSLESYAATTALIFSTKITTMLKVGTTVFRVDG